MPCGDGTGPCGNGVGSGRRNGSCFDPVNGDLSIQFIRLVLANWQIIVSVLLAFAAPALKNRLISLLKSSDDVPLITVVKENSTRLIDAGKK